MTCLKVVIFCALALYSVNGRLFYSKYDIDKRQRLYEANRPSFSPYPTVNRLTSTAQPSTTEFQGKEFEGHSAYTPSPNGEKRYILSEEKLPWEEAKIACTKKGMTLASPENESQQQHLEDYIRSNNLVPTTVYSGYWIGSSRTSGSDWFTWESSGKSVGGFGWLPGEPNDYTGEDCIELKSEWTSLGWNNYYCSEPKRYICEEVATHESLKNEKKSYSVDLHEEQLKTKGDTITTTTTISTTSTTTKEAEDRRDSVEDYNPDYYYNYDEALMLKSTLLR